MKVVHCVWTRNPLAVGPCPRYEIHGCEVCPHNEDVQKKTVPEEDKPAKKPRRKPKTPPR